MTTMYITSQKGKCNMKVLKGIWKVIKWILLAILIFLVLIIGIVFVKSKTNPTKIPDIFGYKPFIVLSGSMESEIYKGDLVIVKNVDPSALKVGDIIAFRDESDHVVTHRIIELVEKSGHKEFVTKGDNNNTEDFGTVSFDKVEGLYLRKIPKMGNTLLVLQKPLTLGIMIGVIVIAGAMWIIIDNSKMSREDKKELERLRKEKASK